MRLAMQARLMVAALLSTSLTVGAAVLPAAHERTLSAGSPTAGASAAASLPVPVQWVGSAWTALADNWWMAFIDGWAHDGGPHAFDNGIGGEASNAKGGKYLDALRHLYLTLAPPEPVMNATESNTTVTSYNTRWNAERLLGLNRLVRGAVNETGPVEGLCSAGYCFPRLFINAHGKHEGNLLPKGPNSWPLERCAPLMNEYGMALASPPSVRIDEKAACLEYVVERYYSAIVGKRIDASAAGPAEALGGILDPLITLFASMAELHAFVDGNSRTRMITADSELTRLGGHPFLLSDTGMHGRFHDTASMTERPQPAYLSHCISIAHLRSRPSRKNNRTAPLTTLARTHQAGRSTTARGMRRRCGCFVGTALGSTPWSTAYHHT